MKAKKGISFFSGTSSERFNKSTDPKLSSIDSKKNGKRGWSPLKPPKPRNLIDSAPNSIEFTIDNEGKLFAYFFPKKNK